MSNIGEVIVLPFRWLWQLVTTILRLGGRLLAVLLGMLLMIAGAALTASVAGACVGIPLMLFGGLLLIRGLF